MPTLTQSMEAAGITTTIERVSDPVTDNKWELSAYHYRVTFTIPGLNRANTRTMVTKFATGNGWDRYPSPAEVMRCVLSESRDVHPAYGEYRFEPWAENFGYDTDSRKVFNACVKQAAELESFLTVPVFNAWLADDELWESEDTDAPTGHAIKRIPERQRKYTRR